MSRCEGAHDGTFCGRVSKIAALILQGCLDRRLRPNFGAIEVWISPMVAVTYYVVVPFDRTENGDLQPGEPQQAISADAASRRATVLAFDHAGVVAFSRTGDPATGEFEEAEILSQAGEVDLDALTG